MYNDTCRSWSLILAVFNLAFFPDKKPCQIFLLYDLIEPVREHVTSACRSIDGEMQTWRPYAIVVLPVYGVLDV